MPYVFCVYVTYENVTFKCNHMYVMSLSFQFRNSKTIYLMKQVFDSYCLSQQKKMSIDVQKLL